MLPEAPGLDYAGICRPARGVSGDYYDFLPLRDSKLGLLLADVSGGCWALLELQSRAADSDAAS
jgi:serine phosphatase RsbU (regulator of sigma subunit)